MVMVVMVVMMVMMVMVMLIHLLDAGLSIAAAVLQGRVMRFQQFDGIGNRP